MKRSVLVYVECVLVAGCTGSSAVDLSGSVGPNGIFDESTTADEAEAPSDAPDVIIEPIVLEWDGLGGDDAVETSSLTLKMRSQSDVALQVGVGIECHGLLGKQAVVALGEISLEPGEETTMEVPATGLPIQNATGASQLFAVAVVRKEGAEADARPEVVGTEALYYRFDSAYANATFFSKAVLKSDFGGCLSGTCTGENTKEQVLGRIADGEGGFTEVKLSEQTATTTVGEKVIGYPEGMSIGEGDQPDVL